MTLSLATSAPSRPSVAQSRSSSMSASPELWDSIILDSLAIRQVTKFLFQSPQTASFRETCPFFVHSTAEKDLEVPLGKGEASSASCRHPEAGNGGPALHGDVLHRGVLEDIVQLHRNVEKKGRLKTESLKYTEMVTLAWLTKASAVLADTCQMWSVPGAWVLVRPSASVAQILLPSMYCSMGVLPWRTGLSASMKC